MQSVINQYKNLGLHSYTFAAQPSGGLCWFGFYRADGSIYAFNDANETLLASLTTTPISLVTLLSDATYHTLGDALPQDFAGFVIRCEQTIDVDTTGEISGGTDRPSSGSFSLEPGVYVFGNTLHRPLTFDIGGYAIRPSANCTLIGSFIRRDGTIAWYESGGTAVHSLGMSAGAADTLYHLLYDVVGGSAYPADVGGFIGRVVPATAASMYLNISPTGTKDMSQVLESPSATGFRIDVGSNGSNFILGDVPTALRDTILSTNGVAFGSYAAPTVTTALSSQVIASGATVNVSFDNTSVGPLGYSRMLVAFTPVATGSASLTINIYPTVNGTVCSDRVIESYVHSTASTAARNVWVDVPHGYHRLSFTAAAVTMSAVSATVQQYPQS